MRGRLFGLGLALASMDVALFLDKVYWLFLKNKIKYEFLLYKRNLNFNSFLGTKQASGRL